jgi:hypothetical protein
LSGKSWGKCAVPRRKTQGSSAKDGDLTRTLTGKPLDESTKSGLRISLDHCPNIEILAQVLAWISAKEQVGKVANKQKIKDFTNNYRDRIDKNKMEDEHEEKTGKLNCWSPNMTISQSSFPGASFLTANIPVEFLHYVAPNHSIRSKRRLGIIFHWNCVMIYICFLTIELYYSLPPNIIHPPNKPWFSKEITDIWDYTMGMFYISGVG